MECGSSAPKCEEGSAVSAFVFSGALSLHGSSAGEARWTVEETMELRRERERENMRCPAV